MKTQIKDIAFVRTGVFAKPTSKGEVAYLQSNHFDDQGNLKRYIKTDLSANSVNPRHLLSPGEVLFSAKGSKNFATVFTNVYPSSVASSSFLVLSPVFSDILPEYLSWFLNSPDVQIQLKKEALGTAIQSITKSSIEDLIIPIPPMKYQEKILEVTTLCEMANDLRNKISKLESKMIEDQIFTILNKQT